MMIHTFCLFFLQPCITTAVKDNTSMQLNAMTVIGEQVLSCWPAVMRDVHATLSHMLLQLCVLQHVLVQFLAFRHFGTFGQFLVSIYSALTSHNYGAQFIVVLPPPFPISTDLLSVMGACFLPCVWGPMAGLPGFSSHGSSPLLGVHVCCRQRKLLDISGTQLLVCDAVTNLYYYEEQTCSLHCNC